MDSPLDCQFYRRFGVEIEVNTSNGVVIRPDTSHHQIPLGADRVAITVHQVTKESVCISPWDHVHNNTDWVVKPDNSCGIEVNSPILKGWRGLAKLMRVVDGLKKAGIHADERCSFHVHVDIADLSMEELASVIAHYIKCEHVFFDAVPFHRRNNRYCQLIGMTDLFDHEYGMDPEDLILRVSTTKYTSLNAYHFIRGGGFSSDNHRKRTIEFRIMEGEACLTPWLVKNWIRFLLHFVRTTSVRPLPSRYRRNDPWSSLLWLEPNDVFSLLKFDGRTSLSDGLRQVRDWFLGRLYCLSGDCDRLPTIWSKTARQFAHQQERDAYLSLSSSQVDGNNESHEEKLYGEKYIL